MKNPVSVSENGDQKPPPADTITAEELCALTGLTDRRHRQLAKNGLFPPPIRGHYQRDRTFAGIVQHFRELLEKRDDTLRKEQQKLTAAKRKIAERELAILEGSAIPKVDIGPSLRNISLHQRSVLQMKLEQELAPNILQLKQPEVDARFKSIVDDVCAIFHDGVKSWMEAPPTS